MFRLLTRSQPVPEGTTPERRLGIDDPAVLVEAVGDLVHRPVAADADDELGAVLDGLAGDVGGVLGLFRELVLELPDEVPQALADLAPALARPAPVRFRVDDDLGLKPHRGVQARPGEGRRAAAAGRAFLPKRETPMMPPSAPTTVNTAAETNSPRRNHPGEVMPEPLSISSRLAGISPPISEALSTMRRASSRLKERRGMETTASTTAATIPVRAPTMAPSPALRRPGVEAARSLTDMAAPPDDPQAADAVAGADEGDAREQPGHGSRDEGRPEIGGFLLVHGSSFAVRPILLCLGGDFQVPGRPPVPFSFGRSRPPRPRNRRAGSCPTRSPWRNAGRSGSARGRGCRPRRRAPSAASGRRTAGPEGARRGRSLSGTDRGRGRPRTRRRCPGSGRRRPADGRRGQSICRRSDGRPGRRPHKGSGPGRRRPGRRARGPGRWPPARRRSRPSVSEPNLAHGPGGHGYRHGRHYRPYRPGLSL